MTVVVKFPTAYFPHPDVGRPVSNGYIYIGQVGLDPSVLGNRITVTLVQEDGSTVSLPPASQPLRTDNGGVFVYNGSPVQVQADDDYSLLVQDRNQVQVYYFPDSNDAPPDVWPTRRWPLTYTDGASGVGLSGTDVATYFGITLTTGDQIITDLYDSNKVIRSGAVFQYTGTTTAGKAGNCPDDDGYFYDASGRQFRNVSPYPNSSQWGGNLSAMTGDLDYPAVVESYTNGNVKSYFTLDGKGMVIPMPEPIVTRALTTIDSSGIINNSSDRFGVKIQNARFDASGMTGGEAAIDMFTYHGVFSHIFVDNINVDYGFRIRSQNDGGYSIPGVANQIFNTLFDVRTEMAAASQAQFFLGENDNGKITDLRALFVSGIGALTGMFVGSGQGADIFGSRHASVDDGILMGRSGRAHIMGVTIDNFGVGRNAQSAYRGISWGAMPSSWRVNTSIGNSAESDGLAGTSVNYEGFRFVGGPAGTHRGFVALGDSALLRSNNNNTYMYWQGDQSADDVVGVIMGGVALGGEADENVARIYSGDAISPYMLVKDVVNGKRKLREHHNDYGWLNTLHDQSALYGEAKFIGSKKGIANSTPTTFATLTLPLVPVSFQLAVTMSLCPASSRGYANRTTKFVCSIQKHSSGTAASASTPAATEDSGVSNSAGVRAIATPTFTLSSSGTTVELQVDAAVTGSAGETAFDIVYKIEIIGVVSQEQLGIAGN